MAPDLAQRLRVDNDGWDFEGRATMAGRNRAKIAAEWAARGFSCDLWTDLPGRRWENVRHAADELALVLEGEMEFEVAGKVHDPKIGEELLIPAGAIHSARNVGTATARRLYGYKGA
jgi:quercetin dioxygenase-like cupin family protein